MRKTDANIASGPLDFNQLVAAIRHADTELSALADRLRDISNCNRRQLYRYLRFCRIYP